jgi:hypothetical protein
MNRSIKRKLILHLGLPKTGTTTLQKHFFPKLEGFRNLGKRYCNPDELFELKFISRFATSMYFAKEENLNHAFKEFYESLMEHEKKIYGAKDAEIPILLSNETFTKYLFLPMYFGYPGIWTLDADKLFERLARFADKYNFDLHILITTREAKEFLHSFYAQMYYRFHSNRYLSEINGFLFEIKSSIDLDSFGVSYLFNDKLEKASLKYFSPENITFLKFEKLFSDQTYFNNSMYAVFGQTVNDFSLSKKENERIISGNKKISSNKPGWQKSIGFWASLKKGVEAFWWHYKTPDQLKREIVWDQESDELFKEIEKGFRNQS